MNFNLPNILTWLRIISIPLLIIVFYTPLGLQQREINYLATIIFVVAAVTDWIDGWLARKWNQTSPFGAFLDPVADKLMVAVVLVLALRQRGHEPQQTRRGSSAHQILFAVVVERRFQRCWMH